MKRLLLAVVGIVALALAGNAIAQTGSGTTDQTGTTAPTYQTPPPAPQGDSSGTQPGSTPPAADAAPQPNSAPAPIETGSSTPPREASTSGRPGSLPATASNDPLMALIGVLALGAFTILLVVRRRGAAKS
jgi:LPXTG-motif cell wall-anchored protein